MWSRSRRFIDLPTCMYDFASTKCGEAADSISANAPAMPGPVLYPLISVILITVLVRSPLSRPSDSVHRSQESSYRGRFIRSNDSRSAAFVDRYSCVGRASSSARRRSMPGSCPFVTRNIERVAGRPRRCRISSGRRGYMVGSPDSDMA